MFAFLRKHLRNTVYSNIWIALGAALWVYAATLVLGNENTSLALLTFFATVFTYNFQRIVKLSRRPEKIVAGRNEWLYRNRFWIWIWVIVGGIGCFFCSLKLTANAWLVLCLSGALSVLYIARIVPGKKARATLRELPGMKIVWIAASWAVVGALLPAAQLDYFPEGLGWMVAEKGLFIVAITIPFDIRDLQYDNPKMRTLPQLLGVKKASALAVVLLLLSALCALGGLQTGLYPLPFVWANLAALPVAGWMILRARKPQTELFFTAGIDGTIALQAALQIAALSLF